MGANRADCILALATPVGQAERAVLRLSGPRLHQAAAEFLPTGLPIPRGRREAQSGVWHWLSGCPVGVELLYFPGPNSATGEDVIELHLPGNAILIDALTTHFLSLGVRQAEAGEFTRRAFLNGRLDLAQAEAVLDLVQARGANQARAAATILAGSLGRELQIAQNALTVAMVQVEAGLDFEEGDSQDLQPGEIAGLLQTAQAALRSGLKGEQARAFRHGENWHIGLIGAPNAGKTSLFQALTQSQGIISNQAGTTRDRLEAPWIPTGLATEVPWILADGPGIGGTPVDSRDQVARQRAQADVFDLIWVVIDASDPQAVLPPLPTGVPKLVLFQKSDLPRAVSEQVIQQAQEQGPILWLSTQAVGSDFAAGAGCTALPGFDELASLTQAEYARAAHEHGATLRSVQRHQNALGQALAAVDQAAAMNQAGGAQDLIAEELRKSLLALAELVGGFGPEELLDLIFSSFCVGK
jgi:tRNA modification GTPase